MNSFSPNHKEFWFVPLGGCGEIGMNLNLYGHAGHWLMVDCGVTFEKRVDMPGAGNQVEMADPVFISNRADSLVGIVATHAHEDHIGALPYLWEQFRCPIYTTPFTRNVILRKLRQTGIEAPVITVSDGETLTLGPFQVQWLPITHSTPETHALLIETPVGRVLHTADWKLDSAPVVGAAIEPGRYQQLGRQRIDAIVCDSTNATRAGHSASESELFEHLLALVRGSTGRVVVGCFASNIARLQTLGRIARLTGRYIALTGRSLLRMVGCAKAAGYLREDFDFLDAWDLGYLPPEETLIIATGSQGEPRSALQRLAMDAHPDFKLTAADHVIFSAKTIPGNETEVATLMRQLQTRDIRVTHADTYDKPIHASGHPCSEELATMYDWVSPRLAIPVHGEERHMERNAEIARDAGVPVTLRGCNGDLFDLIEGRLRRDAVPVGRLWLDERNRKLARVAVSAYSAAVQSGR